MPRPSGRDPESSPLAFLGARLRQARVDAGFKSQEALAARLGFDRTVITKTETGGRPPTDEVLTAWCAACGLKGIPPEWVATMAKRSDGPVPRWFEDYLEAEQEAAIAFERVRGDALSRGQSRELILRLADELWKA